MVLPLVAAVVLGLLAAAPSTAVAPTTSASSSADPRVEPALSLPKPLRGTTALRAVGDRLDDAARLNRMSPARLRTLLTEDPTTWLSPNGRLYYVDPAPADVPESGPVPRGPYPYAQTFLLHSKPGSQRTIYLDFDGATVSGTEWNTPANGNLANGSHPAWDPSGNGAAFDATDQDAIQSVWQRVAEDYAPFDVDVTTQEPTAAAIDRSSAADEVFGTRALITPSSSAITALCAGGCGGIAFIDVFDDPSFHAEYQPAWVFPQVLGPDDPKAVAEAVSHEVGHNMGLEHDGQGATGYYAGHGVWAPIMGDSYGRPVSQWSNGTYTNATQPSQDDVAVIGTSTHAVRADEAGGTIGTAATMPTSGAPGYITTRTDLDLFDLGTCSGTVSVAAAVAPTSPNLDVRLRILDLAGTPVASSNPTSATVDYDVASGLSASISTSLGAGRYYAELDGVGTGNVNTGYDDYGSLGSYTLTQSGCSTAVIGAPSAPQSVTATPQPNGRSVLVSWSTPADQGTSALTGYSVSRLGALDVTTNAATTSVTVTGLDPGTPYTFSVRATNASGPGLPATASATTFAPPGAPTGVAGTQDVGAGTATVTWDPPATTGGAAVSGYEVAADGGTWVSKAAGDRSHTFGGLTGDSHTLAVRALNSVGAGLPSQTVVSTSTPPSEVQNLAYALTGTTVVVTWDPPASDGGSPVLGYEVDFQGTTYDFPTPDIQISSLTRGVTYTVTVRAVNAVGDGPDDSVTFRVPTVPGAARIGTAATGARGGAVTATARWSPPTSTGGSAITGYQVFAYQLNRSNRVVRTISTGTLAASRRRSDVRLPAGRYRFAVRARNAVGWGPLSARSAIVTAR